MPPAAQKPGSVSRMKDKRVRLTSPRRLAGLFISWPSVLIAGLGSIAFHYLCQHGIHYFLDMAAGYRPPPPAGEHHLLPLPLRFPSTAGCSSFCRPLGNPERLAGLHVRTRSRRARHRCGHQFLSQQGRFYPWPGPLRQNHRIGDHPDHRGLRRPGGADCPDRRRIRILLATKLKLSDRERRIMMAAGVGAGVGSIFRAPLAGALFAAEVLYRDPDFESEVIIPAGISSVVAYCVFCLRFGWGSLFSFASL